MSRAKSLSQKLADIKTAKYGEDITLNKPLLVLYTLSEYKKGHGRMLNYSTEVKPKLKALLKKYGPIRRGQATDMPFWRLQHDGFWELENAEACSFKGLKEPNENELIQNKVAGGFDQVSFTLLKNRPDMIDQLSDEVVRKYIPEKFQNELMTELGFLYDNVSSFSYIQRNIAISIQNDIEAIEHDKLLSATTKLRLIEARIGQGKFRSQCQNIYPSCPVTGINFQPLLRASHIKPWAHCRNVKERIDPHNGIMLAAHIDALFDDGWITFNNDGGILVSNKLDLHTFNALNLPENIKPFINKSFNYLEWHRKKIFRG